MVVLHALCWDSSRLLSQINTVMKQREAEERKGNQREAKGQKIATKKKQTQERSFFSWEDERDTDSPSFFFLLLKESWMRGDHSEIDVTYFCFSRIFYMRSLREDMQWSLILWIKGIKGIKEPL